MNQKKLYRSESDKVLAGVCGGIAEYLQVDSTIVRLIVFFLCIGQVGVLCYIVAAAIMPTRPYIEGYQQYNDAYRQNNGNSHYTSYYNDNNQGS